ncbi:hypothetical protein CWC31_15345 [Pseudoalteromonas ruthenica]|uniref:hypothetical protein n=1 Tax=Pseudoalteromonas ruthenica TaxID=151081 RepID=UPI00110913CD|nr:hypothetical protein [Pseudoalteromonas ruthenica]TLX49834.1 hypothetical protein CWC31_15345 [Pseudoalteromonas ruthenica]
MSVYARQALRRREKAYKLRREMTEAGNYTFLQMNSDEFLDFYMQVKLKRGTSRAEIAESLKTKLEGQNINPVNWADVYEWAKKGINQAPLIGDVNTLAVLAKDLHKNGGVFSKYRVKVYAGSPTVIMKVTPSLKKYLTGTSYLAKNPKIITIGVGYQAARNALKGGVVFTVIASPFFRALDQLLYDRLTWHHFVAGVAVDYAVALASVAAAAAVLAVGALLVGVTAATIPMFVVIGVAGSIGLYANFFYADELNDIIEKFALIIVDYEEIILQKLSRKQPSHLEKQPEDFMRKLHGLFGVPYLRDIRQ